MSPSALPVRADSCLDRHAMAAMHRALGGGVGVGCEWGVMGGGSGDGEGAEVRG